MKTDEETGQTIISGMGELHLEIIVDRLLREFNVEANVGKPQVAYRETITKQIKSEGRFIRQSGGRGQYGHVWLTLEPQAPGKGFEFVNRIVGGAIPREYIPAVQKGVVEAMEKGVLAGYPMVDIKVTLIDGSYHEVDSSEMAFQDCWLHGFQGRGSASQPHPSRTLDVHRNYHSGGVYGTGRQRSQCQKRQNNKSGISWGDQCDRRGGSPGQYVWICDRPSVPHPGKGNLYAAIFPL